jgi:FAD/FMN-containing dehydrogenase
MAEGSSKELIAALRDVVSPDHLLVGADDMAPYLVDWRGQYAWDRWHELSDSQATRADILARINDLAMTHRGTFSAEHGIGQKLRGELARYRSPVELRMMRAVKTALDPQGLMNPGKLLPD